MIHILRTLIYYNHKFKTILMNILRYPQNTSNINPHIHHSAIVMMVQRHFMLNARVLHPCRTDLCGCSCGDWCTIGHPILPTFQLFNLLLFDDKRLADQSIMTSSGVLRLSWRSSSAVSKKVWRNGYFLPRHRDQLLEHLSCPGCWVWALASRSRRFAWRHSCSCACYILDTRAY